MAVRLSWAASMATMSFTEVKSALYELKDRPAVKNFVVGVGGRDITMKTVEKLYDNLFRVKTDGLDTEKEWIDLKRPEGA